MVAVNLKNWSYGKSINMALKFITYCKNKFQNTFVIDFAHQVSLPKMFPPDKILSDCYK